MVSGLSIAPTIESPHSSQPLHCYTIPSGLRFVNYSLGHVVEQWLYTVPLLLSILAVDPCSYSGIVSLEMAADKAVIGFDPGRLCQVESPDCLHP